MPHDPFGPRRSRSWTFDGVGRCTDCKTSRVRLYKPTPEPHEYVRVCLGCRLRRLDGGEA